MERRGQMVAAIDRNEFERIIFRKVVYRHRIGLTLYNLEEILDGDLDELIFALRQTKWKGLN